MCNTPDSTPLRTSEGDRQHGGAAAGRGDEERLRKRNVQAGRETASGNTMPILPEPEGPVTQDGSFSVSLWRTGGGRRSGDDPLTPGKLMAKQRLAADLLRAWQ